MTKKIYLDYAASTPVDEKVLEKMLPYFSEKYGNASSLHSFGQEASEAIESARKNLADFFGATPQEIIFTSGATESNNLAVKGVVRAYYNQSENKGKVPHVITSTFEHNCVLKTCQQLEKEGLIEATYISPNEEGIVNPEEIKKAIKDNTILVSIMYVNNEIGTVQPIAAISEILESYKLKNKNLFFHTDATQAVNYFDCNVDHLKIDLLSMSGHKIYAPKGVGALYIRKGTRISRIQDGGSQEFGRRAGTLNTPGIVGIGAAIELLKEKDIREKHQEILRLRDHLINRVLNEIPQVLLNGSRELRSPNNTNFSFLNVEGESLLIMLDMEGIACSTGSACSSGSLQPSHVLLSIGRKHEEAHGSLRVSLGKYTTQEEIDTFVDKLKGIIEKLRKVSGNILTEYYENATK